MTEEKNIFLALIGLATTALLVWRDVEIARCNQTKRLP